MRTIGFSGGRVLGKKLVPDVTLLSNMRVWKKVTIMAYNIAFSAQCKESLVNNKTKDPTET